MANTLKTALSQRPRGESGISLLFTLGRAAPYFKQEIMQYLNVSEWINLRLTNKRHDAIVKQLIPMVLSQCNGWRVYPPSPRESWPRDLTPAEIRTQANAIIGWDCNVRPALDGGRIEFCSRLQAPLSSADNGINGMPCREVVCQGCQEMSSVLLCDSAYPVYLERFGMVLCKGCQGYEMDRHPLGFTSCTCTANLHPLENGWKCHPCRIEAIIALDARIKNSIETMSRLRRTRAGEIIYNFDASQRGKMNYAKCPGCAVRLSAAYVRELREWNGEQTVKYCLACDGIVVRPTRGRRWTPSNLARRRPRRKSVRIGKVNRGKPPLRFARWNYRVVSEDPERGHAVE